MALTKAQVKEILSVAGLTGDTVDTAVAKIMDGHTASINALREERDKAKEDLEKLAGVQKELDDLKANSKSSAEYKKLQDEFNDYKTKTEAKEIKAQKSAAYRKLLKDAGVSEKRLDTVMRASTPVIDDLTIDKDGALKDSENLLKTIKTDWADFIVKEETKGAQTGTPPVKDTGNNKPESKAAQIVADYNRTLYGDALQKKEG